MIKYNISLESQGFYVYINFNIGYIRIPFIVKCGVVYLRNIKE
jgi:hypothetical protein